MVETFHKSSGNVFEDIGFTPAEAAELTAKSILITAIVETIDKRKLTQKEAAQRCGTDQPTLSKVLRGRMESVTIDRLTAWLTGLGRTVEIHVRPYDAKAKRGPLVPTPGPLAPDGIGPAASRCNRPIAAPDLTPRHTKYYL